MSGGYVNIWLMLNMNAILNHKVHSQHRLCYLQCEAACSSNGSEWANDASSAPPSTDSHLSGQISLTLMLHNISKKIIIVIMALCKIRSANRWDKFHRNFMLLSDFDQLDEP